MQRCLFAILAIALNISQGIGAERIEPLCFVAEVGKGAPDGWKVDVNKEYAASGHHQISSHESEDGAEFLRLQSKKSGSVIRLIGGAEFTNAAPGTLVIRFLFRCRVDQLEPTPEWASVQCDFEVSGGRMEKVFQHKSSEESWRFEEKRIALPAGTRWFNLQPGLYFAAGELDIARVDVTFYPEGEEIE